MFDIVFPKYCDCAERSLSTGGIYFAAIVAVATVMLLWLFSRNNKKFLYHYFTVMAAVVMFEFFTSPMWNNPHFGKFAYLYQDVSWVLTLGWSTLILSVVLLVDHFFKKTSECKRFFIYLAGMSVFGLLGEMLVMSLGLRSYSKEVLEVLSNIYIANVPIEVLYYIPVFSALIIGFYKYWTHAIDAKPLVPEKNIKWIKSLILSVVSVLLFELIVEPMVRNVGLPEWSYIYRDISVIMTGAWVLIIWLATKLVDKYFFYLDLKKRFGLYLLCGSFFSVPLEYWYFTQGFREYGESAIRDFSGYEIPFSHLPIEILFAMPMYFALMIGFIKFGELIFRKK